MSNPSSYDYGCHFWSFDGTDCYLGSMGYERSVLGSLPPTDIHMMKCEFGWQSKCKISNPQMSTLLASMDNDNWLSSNHHFASRLHGTTAVRSASVTAVNHHGTIFKSFAITASNTERHCASLCFVHSSSGVMCHFYLWTNQNCYLGNAFHTSGATLPATSSTLPYKTNESKQLCIKGCIIL